MNSLKDKMIFNNRYEIIEWLSREIGHAHANEDTSRRLSDAHEYVQKYCMLDGWGKNVWHTILDDAIKMRKEKEEQND